MANRRANGEGCITKRKDGRWMATLTVGINNDGKPKKAYRYADTQKEVIVLLNQLKSEVMIGVDHSKGSIKTGDWCEVWLNTYKKKLAPSTRTSYQTNLRVHINPNIGGVPLSKLTTFQIQYMLDGVFDDGENSSSLFVKVYNVLNGALSKAVELGMIAKNPMKGIAFPKDNKKKIRVFSLAEQKAFIRALDNEDTKAFFMTYLYTGARLGELPALTWNDINFDDRIVRINKKAIVLYNYYSDGQRCVQEVQDFCKTATSIRNIVITPMLVQVLSAHKKLQMEQVEHLRQTWNDNNLVFPTSNGTVPNTRNIQEKFDRITKSIGIEGATMHSLRHSYATRLFELGVDIKVVSEQLGHKSVKTTYDIYVHVMKDKKITEIDKLNALDVIVA